MASTYLTYTQQAPSTAESQKFTLSMWVKKCANGTFQGLWGNTYSNTHRGYIYFTNSDYLAFYDSGATILVQTNRVFRDTNAWYHIVISADTTQGTASNRVKFYINGVQETSFSTANYPNQNVTMKLMNTTNTPHMGKYVEGGTSYYLNGVISHAHFTQGYTYDATPFGSTDSTTGEWKINTDPTVANYGTNGFWWLKDTIATTDHSPNSNSFTVGGGTLTKTEGCPSNVFATFNPLDGATSLGDSEFSYGNNRWYSNTGSNKCWTRSTLGMTSGKYYFEMKIETASSNLAIGISDRPAPNLTDELGAGAYDYSYQSQNGETINNGTAVSYGNSYTTNDIVMCALDLDNNKLYFGKNGTWQDSGDPTSGSTGTGAAYSVTAPSSTNGGAYFFCGADLTGGNATRLQANFGNGYFGTTAVSSAGSNASNNGIFEYDVPTGYTALSTKGLNL